MPYVSSFLILYFNETILKMSLNLHLVLFLPEIHRGDRFLPLNCSATNLHEAKGFIIKKQDQEKGTIWLSGQTPVQRWVPVLYETAQRVQVM